MAGEGEKVCRKCLETKPVSDFHRTKSSRTKSGYTLLSWCRPCIAAYCANRWREKSQDSEYMQAYRKRINLRRKLTGEQRLRYQNNPVHREKSKEAARVWAQNHPDKVRMYCASRRARRKNATVGPVDLDLILARDKMKCHICGKKIEAGQLSYDHVWPLNRGGEHSTHNIRCSHISCNTKKRDYVLVDFLPLWVNEALGGPSVWI